MTVKKVAGKPKRKTTPDGEPRFPATIGACVDALYRRRQERLDLERSVERLKEGERDLRDHVLGLLNRSKLDGAKGSLATCAVTRKRTWKVSEWPRFWKWCRANDALGVYVQKRLSTEAVGEYAAAGGEVPGVEPFDVVDLSVTKR